MGIRERAARAVVGAGAGALLLGPEGTSLFTGGVGADPTLGVSLVALGGLIGLALEDRPQSGRGGGGE